MIRRTVLYAAVLLALQAMPVFAQLKVEGFAEANFGKGPQARITFFIGDVEVLKAQTSQWVKAYVGLTLDKNDKLRTAAESRAEVDLYGIDVLKVEEGSELELTDVITSDPKQEPITVFHTAGKILLQVKKLLGRKEVKINSPTAVAAIRGTVCGQELLKDGSAKVIVLDGKVYVENIMFKGKGFTVKAGQFSQIRKSQVPLMPKQLNADELKSWSDWSAERHGKAAAEPSGTELADDTPAVTEPAASAPAPTVPAPAAAAPAAAEPESGPAAEPAADDAPAPTTAAGSTPDSDAGSSSGGDDSGGTDKFSMDGAAGSYTDDEGNQVTYISLRPEIPIWKFGVALDIELGFVMEEDGGKMVFNEDDWDEAGDIIDKIYYIRYAKKGDPFYVKAGVLPEVSLGYGLIMNGYSNAIEYPDNKRIGVELGIRKGKFGLDAVLNSVRELGNKRGGGVIGTRVSYRAHRFLEFGATWVADLNQYANLTDTDGEGVPDLFDKFPDDPDEYLDTDDDGYPDGIDNDDDGNNYIEVNTQSMTAADSALLSGLGINYEDSASVVRDPEPFNLDTDVSNTKKLTHVVGFDVGIPVMNTEFLKLLIYGQVAKIMNAGMGVAAPGVQLGVGPLTVTAEYRNFQDEFRSSYFDQLYELERVTITSDGSTTVPVTKREALQYAEAVQGYYAGLDLNLFKLATVSATYEDLRSKSSDTDKTLYAEAALNPSLIPKVSEVSAFYKKSHVENFKTWKQPGAIIGYRLGYEISPGASLVVQYQETYNDTDGDGKIADDEVDRRTGVETVFSF